MYALVSVVILNFYSLYLRLFEFSNFIVLKKFIFQRDLSYIVFWQRLHQLICVDVVI